jgi:hypothetical protein
MLTEDAVVCCIAKDEDLYIDEWLQYNFQLGFSRKSRGEFERKVQRGKADIDEMRTMDEFDMWDKNEVVDDSAWMFLIR